jgi:hypothetical protein
MTDLETLAQKLKEWRGNRRHYRYPKAFWDEIRVLAKHLPIPAIAKACNISPYYLRSKLLDSQPLTFAKVQVSSTPSQVAIEFVNSNAHAMTVRFQADHEQLIRIITSLSAGGP